MSEDGAAPPAAQGEAAPSPSEPVAAPLADAPPGEPVAAPLPDASPSEPSAAPPADAPPGEPVVAPPTDAPPSEPVAAAPPADAPPGEPVVAPPTDAPPSEPVAAPPADAPPSEQVAAAPPADAPPSEQIAVAVASPAPVALRRRARRTLSIGVGADGRPLRSRVFSGLLAVGASMLVVGLLRGLLSFEDGVIPWREWSPPGGGFAVELPADPERFDTTVVTRFGEVTQRSYVHSSEFTRRSYSVVYYDRALADTRTPDEVLDEGRDGTVATVRGTLLSAAPIALGPHPGREVVFESQEDHATQIGRTYTVRSIVRLYLVGRRIYQLTRHVTPDSDGPTDAARFFGSFELRERDD